MNLDPSAAGITFIVCAAIMISLYFSQAGE